LNYHSTGFILNISTLGEHYITLHCYTTKCFSLAKDLQTTARGPNPAHEAISSDPQSHFVNNENVIGLHL